MPRTALNKLVPKADYHLIRSFPKVAQRLESELHSLDRSEMDAYLKLLPGAIERFQGATQSVNDIHESVQVAISQLVTSFGSRNASAVESGPQFDTSNPSAELEETTDSVSEPEPPKGSDTSQAIIPESLSRNELAAAPGNTGESSDQQADGPNPRVRSRQKLSGRARYRRRLQELGEAGND